MDPIGVGVRAASVRWHRLSALLGMIERCVEANARLDASRRSDRGRPPTRLSYRAIDARLDQVTARLGVEVSKLTQERLLVELQRRRQNATSSGSDAIAVIPHQVAMHPSQKTAAQPS